MEAKQIQSKLLTESPPYAHITLYLQSKHISIRVKCYYIYRYNTSWRTLKCTYIVIIPACTCTYPAHIHASTCT